MDIKAEVIEILQEISEDFDPSEEVNLIEDGILDSFDIVSFIIEINAELGVKIEVEDVVPENFESVDSVVKLIERLKNEA